MYFYFGKNAYSICAFLGEKYLSVQYDHNWEWLDVRTHRCTDCGMVTEHVNNGNGICSLCGKACVVPIPGEASTCGKAGHLAYYQYDGKYYSDIELLPHTYSDEWSHNEDFHWHATTCGHNSPELRKDKAEHIYKDGVCIVCGYNCGDPTVNSDYDDGTAGSVFAKPGFWGIIAVAVIAVGGGIALFIVKKKKKPASAKQ